MTVRELAVQLSLRELAMPDGDREVEGGYTGDLLSWVMGRAQSGDAWITIMSNLNIVAVASLADVACVILAEDVVPEQDVVKTAMAKGVNLLGAKESSFALSAAVAKAVQ